MADIAHDEYATFPPGMDKSIKEYWDCILTVLIHPEDDGKGHIPDLIVDDGGDMTLIIHEDKNAEDLLLNDGTISDPIFTYNADFKMV